MAHHFVPNFTREVSNKSKITLQNFKEFLYFTYYCILLWNDSENPDKSQYSMCVMAYVWGDWHGGIYWDWTEMYTAIKMMSLLDQDNASSHSTCATTAWFRRDRVNVLDWQQICLQLKMYEQSWKWESDNDDHRLLSIWSLVSSKTGQKICLQNFNN